MRFTRWDQKGPEGSYHESISRLVQWHACQISEPSLRHFAEGVARQTIPLRGIVSFEIDYTLGATPNDYAHLRQILAFFQKRKDLDLGIDTRAVAKAKFLECEARNQETNSFFKLVSKGSVSIPRDVSAVFFAANRKISRLLGDIPSLSELKLKFGPGATTRTKRKISSPRQKLGMGFCCSEGLSPFVARLMEEMPAWLPFGEDQDSALVDVSVDTCRLGFVPKNAKTDRGICSEPGLNVMLQLGIGDYLARRLKRFGVDISDQTANQRAAHEGSLTGALATLDLSSASDLICTELVYHLLPVDWAMYLDAVRSKDVDCDGTVLTQHKFSSMGNGFTFPLETLIFWGLATAVVEVLREEGPIDQRVLVYGDDIIVPTAAVGLLLRVLQTCGFIVNNDKSFWSGPFRESCGADYCSGLDIRPCYLKEALSAEAAFTLHNFYARKGLFEAADIVRSSLDPTLQIWGPDGYGDGHLIGDYPRKPYRTSDGWSGHVFSTFTWKAKRDFTVYSGDRVLPCYTIYANPPIDSHPRAAWLDPHKERWWPIISDRAPSLFKGKNGDDSWGVTIPGTSGFKRISIYVLN